MAEVTITEAEDRERRRYVELGTPSDLSEKLKKNTELEADNKKLRDERTELRKKVPGEGAVVLQGDDAKRWDAFQALGKTPEELAAGLVLTPDERKEWDAFNALEVKAADVPHIVKERDELKQKDAQRSRMDTLAAAVEAMGWPKERVAAIADMKSLDEVSFEVKVEKAKDANGADTDAKVAYVTPKGGQPTKLADFASQNDALKGLLTTSDNGGEKEKEKGNKWMETPTGGKSSVRSPEDHAKAITAQLDYNV
jgi:hypothetical protein